MITQFQLDEMQRRLSKGKPEPSNGEPVGREKDLHDAIEADLKLRRWYYIHSRMDRPTTNQMGTCDFIVAIPSNPPVTLWIEAKRKNAKLSKEQQIAKHILLASNHKYKTVFSFPEYLDFVKENVNLDLP